MKRWNGWGDERIEYPLPEAAAAYLAELIGPGNPIADTTIREVITAVPESRLVEHSLVKKDPVERLRHARGQSLPDWIALRSGRIGTFPDGVAYPNSNEDIKTLLNLARETGAHLIPYGGGTSVVGHINSLPGDVPVLVVDLSHLSRLIEIDEMSRLATFEAGIRGPELEAELGPYGFTLGHFPQSFEYSTLGGWIATRSSGQQSYYYGRIEELFAGGHIEMPIGALDLPPCPASAAGPDLRHLLLGSEGRLGFITQATVRIRPLPSVERFLAIFFRDWPSGVSAAREVVQNNLPISMIRLSDPQETETTLALAGMERLVNWADRGLRLLRYGSERCLLIFGVTGDESSTDRVSCETTAIARKYGGLNAGGVIGNQWRKSRFKTPYLRNALWDRGYAIDTLETAVPWSNVLDTVSSIKDAIQRGLEDIGELVLVIAHLSHIYQDGASIYVTYLYRRSPDPEETFRRWRVIKSAASEAIVAQGGTISHQHGIGLDHASYLKVEKGELGVGLLESARYFCDPGGVMNPGKLLSKANDKPVVF